MKCLGLCGLHGAGKTHIAARLRDLGGWTVIDKRLELKRLYESGWFRRNKHEAWEAWYRYTYERFGSGPVMLKMLETVSISTESVVVIDAIYTPEEWKSLQGYAPGSVLAGVWAPQAIRDVRRDEPSEMDARRAHFWHHSGACLMSTVEWVFPGSLPGELLDCFARSSSPMSPIFLKRLCPPSTSEDRGLSVSEIAKSGLLVFRRRGNKTEFLLLHRQKQNDWSFPKGHVEKGEGLLEAGLREVFEEANMRPMVVGRLIDLEYLDGKGRQIRLALFLGYTEEKNDIPNVSSEGEAAEWVPLARVERALSYENLQTYFRTYVKPLFSQKQSGDQIHTDVIFSETEQYKNEARLLTHAFLDGGISSDPVELNRLILKKENRPIKQVSYFLTNHQNVPNAAFWCKEFGSYVINECYLRSWHSKSQVQRFLKEHGVPVFPSEPYLFSSKKHNATWMMKSERHGMKNFISMEASKRSSWDAYFEQKADEKRFTEIKLGYIAGQILTDAKDLHLSSGLISALHRVQEYLGLEIFSTDIFVDKMGTFYIVDVNPAPAFFHNMKARRAFASYIGLIERFYLKQVPFSINEVA